MTMKVDLRYLAVLCCLSTAAVSNLYADFFQDFLDNVKTKRVLLTSIDGMHSLDLANYVASNPGSDSATKFSN